MCECTGPTHIAMLHSVEKPEHDIAQDDRRDIIHTCSRTIIEDRQKEVEVELIVVRKSLTSTRVATNPQSGEFNSTQELVEIRQLQTATDSARNEAKPRIERSLIQTYVTRIQRG